MKVVVEIVAGALAGRRLEFDDPTVLRFGRHPSNDVVLDAERDRDASSRHAEIRREGAALFLYDLNSANGTKVDGIPAGDRTPIRPGAEIELGAGGPRCRVSYDGLVPRTVPPTVHRGGQAPLAPGARVGARTVAMMIDDAMRRVRGGSKRLQIVAVSLGVALFLALAAVVVAFTVRPPEEVAVRRAMVKLMEQQRSAEAHERAELQRQLDALQARLSRAGGHAQAGSEVARKNHDAIYLVTVRTDVQEEGFCTAFAIDRARLVTNAHCVHMAEDFRRRGGQIWVVQNGHPETRLKVERLKKISSFSPTGGITADVGWLKVDGALAQTVTLAPAEGYRALATGDTMYTYGFPGRLAEPSAPEATFVEGVVGRITTLDGRTGDARDTQLIQHSAFTSGGTSGSPIFNAAGQVVAVNTGGYSEAEQGTGKVVTRSLPGYNFGMRVDLVEALLKEGEE